jgi:hypothetical protein
MAMKKSSRARKPAARGNSRAKSRAKKHTSMMLFDRIRRADPNSLAVAVAGVVAVALVITGLASTPAATVARSDTARADARASMPAGTAAPRATPRQAASASNSPKTTGAPAAKIAQAPPAPVTIAGCLERDGESFRLRDTSGAAAPRGRSWKSGFLRKGPSPVAVQDPGRQLNLTRYVGSRVSVTGTLDGRAIRGSALRRVSASCDEARQVKI